MQVAPDAGLRGASAESVGAAETKVVGRKDDVVYARPKRRDGKLDLLKILKRI